MKRGNSTETQQMQAATCESQSLSELVDVLDFSSEYNQLFIKSSSQDECNAETGSRRLHLDSDVSRTGALQFDHFFTSAIENGAQ